MPVLPSTKDVECAVLGSTNELVATFQAAPYAFLFESDLRAELLVRLRSRITHKLPVPRTVAGTPPYSLALVYSEYRHRIDIACLVPQNVKDAQRTQYKGLDTFIYALPVHIGIELKYRKMGDVFDFSSCDRDYRKLSGLSSTVQIPFVLAFVQDAEDLESFLVPSHRRMDPIQRILDFDSIYVITPTEIVPVLPEPKG